MARDNEKKCGRKGPSRVQHRILAFEELIAPLSYKKVMLVIECLSIDGCENPEIMSELTEVMNLGFGADYDEWDDFLDYGFVVIEGAPTSENIAEASLLVDYLRHEKFQPLIQADLFVDGVQLSSSWNGNPAAETVGQVSTQPVKPIKSVLIRFPLERVARRNETDNKE